MNIKISREIAIEMIKKMEPKEFQTHLLNDTIPDFDRKFLGGPVPIPLERQTNFSFRLLTDEECEEGELNQGYLKRHHLEFISLLSFKQKYYEEFRNIQTEYENKYYECVYDDKKMLLETSMDWIMHMSSQEFEDRIFEDSLPNFDRDPKSNQDEILDNKKEASYYVNLGYLHRNELRYMDADEFRNKYYPHLVY